MPRVFINVESPDDVVHCDGRGGDLVRHDLLLFPFVLSLLPSLMLVWVRRGIYVDRRRCIMFLRRRGPVAIRGFVQWNNFDIFLEVRHASDNQ
jgi:hypothetical protein